MKGENMLTQEEQETLFNMIHEKSPPHFGEPVISLSSIQKCTFFQLFHTPYRGFFLTIRQHDWLEVWLVIDLSRADPHSEQNWYVEYIV